MLEADHITSWCKEDVATQVFFLLFYKTAPECDLAFFGLDVPFISCHMIQSKNFCLTFSRFLNKSNRLEGSRRLILVTVTDVHICSWQLFIFLLICWIFSQLTHKSYLENDGKCWSKFPRAHSDALKCLVCQRYSLYCHRGVKKKLLFFLIYWRS